MAERDHWQPISSEALWAEVNGALSRMNEQQRRFWEVIRITPEKWQQDPFGKEGGGFWAVALVGATVVWYNDIEEGFNRSRYRSYGVIDEYWCDQDELELAIQKLMNLIGGKSGAFGPPGPLELPSI